MGQDLSLPHWDLHGVSTQRGQSCTQPGFLWGRGRPQKVDLDPTPQETLPWGKTFLYPIGIVVGSTPNGANPAPNQGSYGAGGAFLGFLGTHLSRRSGPSPTTSQRSPRTAAVTRSRPTRSWGPARASATVTRATSSPPRAPGDSHCPPNVTACGFGDKKGVFRGAEHQKGGGVGGFLGSPSGVPSAGLAPKPPAGCGAAAPPRSPRCPRPCRPPPAPAPPAGAGPEPRQPAPGGNYGVGGAVIRVNGAVMG